MISGIGNEVCNGCVKFGSGMKLCIFYIKLFVIELEVCYVIDVVVNGWGEKCYEYINWFEGVFKVYLGVKYVIVILSCIGVFYMGMVVLGIGFGDEVIMVDINWIVMVFLIVYLGVRFVFVDIFLDFWCFDLGVVE